VIYTLDSSMSRSRSCIEPRSVATNRALSDSGEAMPARAWGVVIAVDAEVGSDLGVVVDEQRDVDVTSMRLTAPFEPRSGASSHPT
jgi:hypothetical protein